MNKDRVKIILLIIAILNIILTVVQGGSQLIIIQICLGALLLRGNKLVKALFVLGYVLGIIFSVLLLIQKEYLLSIIMITVCLFILYMLLIDRGIQSYFRSAHLEKQKINVKEIILFITFMAMFIIGFNTHRRSGLLEVTRNGYRNEVQEVEDKFPFIDIEKCYWKIGIDGKSTILNKLNYIVLDGYLVLTTEEFEYLLLNYEWSNENIKTDYNGNPFVEEETMLSFKRSYSVTDIMGIYDFDWRYNNEFSEMVNKDYYIGDLFLDTNNGIIYFNGKVRLR